VGTDFEAEGLLEGVEGADTRRARLELLRELEEKGFALEDLRAAVQEGRLPLLAVEHALEGSVPHYTIAELAEKAGLTVEQMRAVNRAVGLARPDPDERVFTDADVVGARNARLAMEAGLPEADLLEITRVTSRSAAAVAAAAFRSVGEAFTQAGDTERDLGLRYAEATSALAPLLAQSIEQMLVIHLRELARQTAVTEEQLATGRLPGEQAISVCFADLVGFTKLGERLLPEEIGALAERLGELAVELAGPPVRLVKTIGDAVMLVSREPDPLVDAALDLVEAAETEGGNFPELRAGVARGPGLARGGDWYGRPVNLASRITGVARPSSVLASEELKDSVERDYAWSFAGKRRLKGVRGEVGLFRVRRADAAAGG
jgi:adenylate cyclase